MGNSSYQKGYKFERDFMDLMRMDGWKAFRCAGSHSMFDVILMPTSKSPGKRVVGCQLKYWSDHEPKPDQDFVSCDVDVEKWWVTKKKYGLMRIEIIQPKTEVVIPSSDALIATGLRPTY